MESTGPSGFISRSPFLILGLTLLSPCLGKSTYRWKEQVQLHDGRVITIRTQHSHWRATRTTDGSVQPHGQPPPAAERVGLSHGHCVGREFDAGCHAQERL